MIFRDKEVETTNESAGDLRKQTTGLIKEQVRLIQYAVMFYTRLPVPSLEQVDQSTQDHASRYFPLIGWLIGGLCAGAYLFFDLLFSQEISVLLVMCLGIWLTGAFHEDGLADTCDGIGGGWDKATILNIMKDSRVGTYGLVGLTAVLAIKFVALSQLPAAMVPFALIVGHVLSRWYSNLVMWQMDYVRMDERSKAKPITKGFKTEDFSIASVIALLAVFCLPLIALPSVLIMALPVVYLVRKLKVWLGGYTGDALGAVQQVSEVAFYLGLSLFLV